jgi:hypothetical protein
MDSQSLLVITRTGDPAVEMLRSHAPGRVVHACVADLSRPGWRYDVGSPEQLSAGVNGASIRAERIAAVLCRIGAIVPVDLPHIHADDRIYVAAEMNAFLHAWLSQFGGVRFNDPSWVSLAGPSWHDSQWTWLLERAGVPVVARRPRSGSADARHDTVIATLVGDDVLGTDDRTLIDYTHCVANIAHSELLSVSWVRDGGWRFVSADPCPPLDAFTAAAVVRGALNSRSRESSDAA